MEITFHITRSVRHLIRTKGDSWLHRHKCLDRYEYAAWCSLAREGLCAGWAQASEKLQIGMAQGKDRAAPFASEDVSSSSSLSTVPSLGFLHFSETPFLTLWRMLLAVGECYFPHSSFTCVEMLCSQLSARQLKFNVIVIKRDSSELYSNEHLWEPCQLYNFWHL